MLALLLVLFLIFSTVTTAHWFSVPTVKNFLVFARTLRSRFLLTETSEIFVSFPEDRRLRADLIEVFMIVKGLSSIPPETFLY